MSFNVYGQPKDIVVKTFAELAALIEKGVSNGVKVFRPRDGELVEVDMDAAERLLADMAGRVEDATREPMYSPGKFPTETVPNAGVGHGEPINAVPKPYDMVHPTVTRLPGGTFVMSNVDPGIASPLNFNEPTPGREPADGPEAVDYHKAGPVFKRASKVSFADIVKMEGTDHGPQTFGGK